MTPIVLIILDGWGYSKQKHGNAILNAQTPYMDYLQSNYPSLLLQASGKAVGLAWGEPGNSEVGHLTIGAGRIIFQNLSRINKAIETSEFFSNPTLTAATNHAKSNNSTLHLAGLITSGSVHAYLPHLFSLLTLAKKEGLDNVLIHAFTDGKDSGLKEGAILLKKIKDKIETLGVGQIATVIGRDFAMDRDKNWELTKKTYDLLVNNEGEKADNPIQKLEEYYSKGILDPRVPPTVLIDNPVKDGDALIFFNFRGDSMSQIARAISKDGFDFFQTKKVLNLFVATMTPYIDVATAKIAFPAPQINNGLAEIISQNKLVQLHIAETEKYAHITHFFNCLKNKPFDGETDLFIDSEKSPLIKPEMKSAEITEKIIGELGRNFYDFIIVNFANPDILSHTGNLEATIKGIEAVDDAVGKITNAVLEKNGMMIITADHGNAESIIYKQTGEKATRHDENPVPFFLVAHQFQVKRSDDEITASMSEPSGILADVAPTILELMGIEKPEEMTGNSLLRLLQ